MIVVHFLAALASFLSLLIVKGAGLILRSVPVRAEFYAPVRRSHARLRKMEPAPIVNINCNYLGCHSGRIFFESKLSARSKKDSSGMTSTWFSEHLHLEYSTKSE
jgi:hypothetical protein